MHILSENTLSAIEEVLSRYVITPRTGKAIAALLLLWGGKRLYGDVSLYLYSQKMERLRQDYRDYCKISLDMMGNKVKQKNISKEEIEKITSLDLETLVAELKNGNLRPSRVLTAYQAKALEVHKITNCLIHAFDEADAIAAALDDADEETRNKPLYGVPMSFKDDYGVKGYGSALGMANLLYWEAEDDCNMVKVLKNAGAVPFVKTNVPHIAFSLLCSNPIMGETTHPLDKTRTSGGSSGGEAALIGGGGSILGMGSDIGGSLREPAAFCGICTIRPTVGRLSFVGQPHSHFDSGQHRMCTSYGPMARNVASLVRFCRVLFVPELYEADMFAAPIPFNEELYGKTTPLKVGVFSGEQLFPVSPPARRALREAREALEALGHTVVDWNPENQEMMRAGDYYYRKTMVAAEGSDLVSFMRGDPPDWCIKPFFDLVDAHETWWGWAKAKINTLLSPDSVTSRYRYYKTGSISEYWKDEVGLHELRTYVETSFREAGLDCIICPAFPSCAVVSEEESVMQASFMNAHNVLWNAMDVPTAVVPVTKVKESDFPDVKAWDPQHENCFPWVRERTKEDLLSGAGLPLGVMVAAMRWKEETVLRAMSEIERGLNKSLILV